MAIIDLASAEIEKKRLEQEFEAMKAIDQAAKLTKKLEDEVKLRISFEQKMNTLHHVNMEADSKAILFKEKFEKMEINYLNGQIWIK